MPMPLQAKLLRALQERKSNGRHSRPPRSTHGAAATNVDLMKLVREGSSVGSYYRLNVVRVQLPRGARAGRTSRARAALPPQSVAQSVPLRPMGSRDASAQQHPWPGNIRQLENAHETRGGDECLARNPAVDVAGTNFRSPIPTQVPAITIPDGGISFASVLIAGRARSDPAVPERTGGNRRQAAFC